MYERLGKVADVRQKLMFVMGGGTTRRYHTVPTVNFQTVGQHSFGVAWLCYLLTDGKAPGTLIMAALAHDMAEQVWGDIPSPAKKRLGVTDTITKMEEDMLFENFASFPLSEEEARILKLADNLDGLIYCIQERRLGNRNMEIIFRRYRSYIGSFGSLRESDKALLNAVELLWEESCNG